jgi:hypothetical protein
MNFGLCLMRFFVLLLDFFATAHYR